MKAMKIVLCVMLCATFTVGIVGCGMGAVMDLVNAGLKVAEGNLAGLTSSEIMILNQTAGTLVPELNLPTLTEPQATALVTFFTANSLTSAQAITDFSEQVEADPTDVEGLEALAAAFADSVQEFDAGTATEEDLQEILGSIFGGGQGSELGETFAPASHRG